MSEAYEIEKMYENAGIKPDCTYLFLVDGNGENEAARTISIGSKADLKRLIVDCGVKGRVIKSTNTLKSFYPPFTAEKQLAIFKMFCRRYLEVSQHIEKNGDLCFGIKATVGDYAVGFNKDFEECLADFVNCLWQSLTEEEKEQIREILK